MRISNYRNGQRLRQLIRPIGELPNKKMTWFHPPNWGAPVDPYLKRGALVSLNNKGCPFGRTPVKHTKCNRLLAPTAKDHPSRDAETSERHTGRFRASYDIQFSRGADRCS